MHSILAEHRLLQSRRQFLQASGVGLGVTALSSLLRLGGEYRADHPPAAKRVIFLFMAGAPSQIDLFDYKPGLQARFKEPLPESISQGQRVTAMTRGATQLVAPSMFGFRRSGQSGVWWSDLLPHLSSVADDICVAATTAAIPPRPSARASVAAHNRRERSFNTPDIDENFPRIH